MVEESELNEWRDYLSRELRAIYDEWIQSHLIHDLEDSTLENPSEYLNDIWDMQDDIDRIDDILYDLNDMQISLDNAESDYNLSNTSEERRYTFGYLEAVLEDINGVRGEANELIDELESLYGDSNEGE